MHQILSATSDLICRRGSHTKASVVTQVIKYQKYVFIFTPVHNSCRVLLFTGVAVKGKIKRVPFLGVESDSSWAVSADVAAADEESELFGGLNDRLPKFCLFSFAFASSLSKAAVSHRSTVDTNSLQN